MTVKAGYEHMGVAPDVAALMRATLEEYYFHRPNELVTNESEDADRHELLAAWLGEEE